MPAFLRLAYLHNEETMMIFNSTGFIAHKDLKTQDALYRIFPMERLLQFLQTKEMYFHKVTAWEDPWEICSRFIESSGKNLTIDGSKFMADCCYGTCWTTTADSDAFWRIYSSDKSGLCIKTTAEKLFRSMDIESTYASSIANGFIAPIRYVDFLDEEWWSVFEDEASKHYPSYMLPAFIKRKAFDHEHEVRLLMTDWFPINGPMSVKRGNDGKGIFIPFHDTSFIEEIILDPRSDDGRLSIYQKLFETYNIPVSKSELYKVPTILSPSKEIKFSNDPAPVMSHQAWHKDSFIPVDRP